MKNKRVKQMMDSVGGVVFGISIYNKARGINKQQVFFRNSSKFAVMFNHTVSIKCKV